MQTTLPIVYGCITQNKKSIKQARVRQKQKQAWDDKHQLQDSDYHRRGTEEGNTPYLNQYILLFGTLIPKKETKRSERNVVKC